MTQPIIGVVKVRIGAEAAPALVEEAIAVLAQESKELEGFLSGEVLLSVDQRTVVILTEWTDRHAWSRSRYDVRVGNLVDHFFAKSTAIEFEIYTRHGQIRPATT